MGPGGRAICWLWMRSLSLRLGGRRWRRWLVLGFMVRISRTTEPGCNIERAYCCSAHGEHCQSAKKVFRVLLLPFSAHAFIHDLGSSQDPSLISKSIIHHFPSPIPPPSSSPRTRNIYFAFRLANASILSTTSLKVCLFSPVGPSAPSTSPPLSHWISNVVNTIRVSSP